MLEIGKTANGGTLELETFRGGSRATLRYLAKEPHKEGPNGKLETGSNITFEKVDAEKIIPRFIEAHGIRAFPDEVLEAIGKNWQAAARSEKGE